MEGKIIAKSKPASKFRFLIFCVAVTILMFAIMLVYYYSIGRTVIMEHLGQYYNLTFGVFLENAMMFFSDGTGAWTMPFVFYIGVIALVWGIIRFLKYKNMELTVTEKHVFGVSSFGKRVDIPVSKISSVVASGKRNIFVLTSSGKTLFGNFKNADELFEAINGLLLDR